MFKIDSLTAKNFMSVGNTTQAIDFNRQDLTLVLGENLDTGGGDAGSRNGTGKTTIINALSYALYGNALTNIAGQTADVINATSATHNLGISASAAGAILELTACLKFWDFIIASFPITQSTLDVIL